MQGGHCATAFAPGSILAQETVVSLALVPVVLLSVGFYGEGARVGVHRKFTGLECEADVAKACAPGAWAVVACRIVLSCTTVFAIFMGGAPG